MPGIGIGISPVFGRHKGTDWVAYWATRTISALAITVDSDVQFTLNWTNDGTADYDGHKIYLSIDGITYALNKTVASVGTTTTVTGLTTNTRYYIKVAPYKGVDEGTLSAAANDWTAAKIPLAATGTGASAVTVRFWFGTTDVVATVDGNGKWYSDLGGTLDESASYTFVAGALRTRYLKVTSGASNMLVFAKGNWLRWGDNATGYGWEGTTNRPTTSVTLEALPSTLTCIRLSGNNTVSGSVASRTNLLELGIVGSNTISGSLVNLTSLTSLSVQGSNTLSGSIANLTSLTWVNVTGSNTISGDIGVNNMVNGCLSFVLNPCRMDTYTGGATWSNATINIQPSVGYGYSSAEIDAMLIDMANSPTLISKTITLTGSSQARTAASDAAIATLTGVGRTCTVVTNP